MISLYRFDLSGGQVAERTVNGRKLPVRLLHVGPEAPCGTHAVTSQTLTVISAISAHESYYVSWK